MGLIHLNLTLNPEGFVRSTVDDIEIAKIA